MSHGPWEPAGGASFRRRRVSLGRHGAPAVVSFPEATLRAIVIVLPGGGLPFDKGWAEQWLPPDGAPVLRAYVDLPLHGERLAGDLRERFRHDRVKGFYAPAILGMAREIPSIIDDLAGLAVTPSLPKVGICGWSIGGLAALLAALEERRIGAAAGFAIPGGGIRHLQVNRQPDEEGERLLRELDLFGKAPGLHPTPVLLMHGGQDTWVHPESSRALHAALQPVYAGSPEKLRYVEYPMTPHDPCGGPPEERTAIRTEVEEWLEKHLA